MIKLTHLSNRAIKLNDDGSQQANSTYGCSYGAVRACGCDSARKIAPLGATECDGVYVPARRKASGGGTTGVCGRAAVYPRLSLNFVRHMLRNCVAVGAGVVSRQGGQ